jgi:hypothetical protein
LNLEVIGIVEDNIYGQQFCRIIHNHNKRRAKMKIKAAVVSEKSGKFSIENLDMDDPREDEVLVKVAGAGICHMDLAAREQHLQIPCRVS